MQSNRLTKTIKKDVWQAFRSLCVLAFFPVVDVVRAFNLIKTTAPTDINGVLEYFEEFYIGNLVKGSKTVRKAPIFPIQLWNCFDRVLSDSQRTNNSVEAWHKQFAYCPTLDNSPYNKT